MIARHSMILHILCSIVCRFVRGGLQPGAHAVWGGHDHDRSMGPPAPACMAQSAVAALGGAS